MELIRIGNTDADKIAPLVAAFRTQLKSCKGIKSQPDIEAGKEEIYKFVSVMAYWKQAISTVATDSCGISSRV